MYLIFFCTAFILYWLMQSFNKRPKMFPNGPAGLPIVGNLYQLGLEPHKKFLGWGKVYGDIFSLQFGKYRVIVLNNYEDIKEAFKSQHFSGRPKLEPVIDRCGGCLRGIVFNAEQGWTEQRRFTTKAFKDLGFGSNLIETLIYSEVNELITHFKENFGSPVKVQYRFNAAVMNVLWKIITGARYSHDDPILQDLINGLTSSRSQSNTTASYLFLPWWYKIRTKLSPLFQGARNRLEITNKSKQFVEAAVKSHQRSIKPENVPRDFIYTYLKEIEQTSDTNSSFYKNEGLSNLIITLLDLFVAGTETTGTALSWIFVLLAMFQNKQKKLFEEIKNVVGLKDLPSLKDRGRMPYATALIQEVMRFTSLVPLAAIHETTENSLLRDYVIPKKTLVLANLYGAMHDIKFWGDPEVFRPERFLTNDGKQLIKQEGYLPFSTGRRMCLGLTLAQDELFLITVCIFQRFHVNNSPNGNNLDYVPAKILMPKQNAFIILERPEFFNL